MPLRIFAHGDDVAAAVVLDLGHEVAHEQQAAAAGALEVLGGGRVGHVLGVEARPLVGDADVEPLGSDRVRDEDALVRVHLVAVLDGVDEGLFEGELDGEDVVLGVAGGLERLLDLRPGRAGASAEVARDGDFDGMGGSTAGVPRRRPGLGRDPCGPARSGGSERLQPGLLVRGDGEHACRAW